MTSKYMCVHLDIRAFFATCKQQLNPEYEGKPIAIYNEGKDPKTGEVRQKIIAASKEAKERYQISQNTDMDKAKRIPGLILIKNTKSSRKEYVRIAEGLYQKCRNYVEGKGFEISSPHIDDIVIRLPDDPDNAMKLARDVEGLYNESGFDLAIGISFNKDYARIATKIGKRYGLTYFGRGYARRFIYKCPVIKFPWIGEKRKERLNKAGIKTIGDIANSPLGLIMDTLGEKTGMKIYYSVRGMEPDEAQLELFENG